jgi:hypothetical protein
MDQHYHPHKILGISYQTSGHLDATQNFKAPKSLRSFDTQHTKELGQQKAKSCCIWNRIRKVQEVPSSSRL